MMQELLFVPTAQGEQAAAALHQRLHAHRADPGTATAAVPRPAALSLQAEWVLDVIQTHGPGTPWELAHRAWNHGTTLAKANVTELYYAIQRRAHDLVVAERIRVTGERPCTIKQGGRHYQVLEAWR